MQIAPILEEMIRTKEWTQGDIATKLGVSQPTVSRWLEGSEPKIKQRDKIVNLARKLGILPSGDESTVPIVGYVGAGGQILFTEGQGPFGEAKMPPGGASKATVAVVVKGDSMAGQLEDGWTVYYDRRQTPPFGSLLGHLCVVWLSDGRVLIKKLLPGRQNGLYDLYSVAAAPLLDQAVEWAAQVSWIAPT